MASQSQSITATGRYSLAAGVKGTKDTVALISVTGTFTGLSFAVQGTPDGTNWCNIVAQNLTTGSTSTGTIAATDSTTLMLRIPCDNMSNVGVNVSAFGTGSPTLQIITDSLVGVLTAISSTNAAVTTTLTSTSANALAVGPNGVTNPTFNVDASTTSAATGLQVKSAAAASGVAVQVLSSGTNEALTIDAKAAAVITLAGAASTATGVTIGSSTSAANVVATVYSSNATAFQVGPNGSTNPTFVVVASTSSAATGIKVVSAAAAAGVALQVLTSGTNEDLTIDAAAAGTIKLGSVASTALGVQVGSSTAAANASLIVQSTKTTGFVVGRLGATTPAFQVDPNTATSITGIKIKSAATGNGVALSAIGEASNGALKIDAQGSGVIALGDTSTGGVCLNRGNLQALQVGMTLTALGTTQSSTPTSAQLLGGIITQTGSTGAGTITLPTGTALSTACPRTPATGDTFECTFVNVGGGQTLTVTGATGTTVVGGATIATAKSAKLVFTLTGANAWSIYTIGG